jgi:(p)ppGpp synthase/HD superfamily hydrolase
MNLNPKQEIFLEFVKEKHGEQKRKYTGEPYWYHVVTVADITSKFQDGLIEIAFGHDLLEDTECSESELEAKLLSIGYDLLSSDYIIQGIIDLTDVYTPEDYPELNRLQRKNLEAERLANIHPDSQTVKYADIIHNVQSIVEYDKGFAKKYLIEKKMILDKINNSLNYIIRTSQQMQK